MASYVACPHLVVESLKKKTSRIGVFASFTGLPSSSIKRFTVLQTKPQSKPDFCRNGRYDLCFSISIFAGALKNKIFEKQRQQQTIQKNIQNWVQNYESHFSMAKFQFFHPWETSRSSFRSQLGKFWRQSFGQLLEGGNAWFVAMLTSW